MASLSDNKIKILPPNVNAVIEGRTIVLRPITENEINERYLSWLNNIEINRFLEIRYQKQTIADICNYINGLRGVGGCEVFAVFFKKDHVHIGNVAITQYNRNNQGTTIYGAMIGEPRALILGAGAEAEVLIIEFLFRNPEIRKVKAGAHAENHKSWRLLESLGFKREAVLRKEAVLSSSQICDVYLYGLLKEEWLEQRMKFSSLLHHIKVVDEKKSDAIKD